MMCMFDQDYDEITVDYPSIKDLMKDLKGMVVTSFYLHIYEISFPIHSSI